MAMPLGKHVTGKVFSAVFVSVMLGHCLYPVNNVFSTMAFRNVKIYDNAYHKNIIKALDKM